MQTISATDAKNKIGDLWTMAESGPVTVERNGSPCFQVIPIDKYVAVPRDDFDRMHSSAPRLESGFAADLLEGVDVDALLAVDLTPLLKDYL
jgi:prevent-host-death family protein